MPDRPISMVLHDIVSNLQDIIRSEMRMARTEVAEELRKSRSAAMMLGAGALMLIFSVLFVLLAIVYALSLVMAAWAAALIVGVAVGVIAAMCCVAGVKKFKTLRAAPRTVESVKENVQWAKQLTR
jgi:uncharacterized membrane protein YqjE